ncbi:hypothetical protein E0Z10_g7859 [Xylaria hypoxylon]|uniref:CN hydrolase domain-containing protein n=1 Tax=Xylaria hypoxylon TaxID=37992 RepID=A0A4Z0YLA9_9PEZI|nr:hypothetical protein E0Z10_g7859 [Xylaria hypoxylon]
MRIGCLQFAPQIGDIENNIDRVDALLSKANPENLDLLVLPELAFEGYNFKSLQEISPFLEPQGSGISAVWARTVALKLNCVVTVGYPEKEDVESKWPTSPEYYNSVIVVNADGDAIANYRKNFLYYTDETWALEGQAGFYGGLIPGLGTASMGISFSPYKFEAPWHAFEFAFHCLEVKANLVIVTMAWLTREDASVFSCMPNEPDMDTLTYWIARLEPLIRSENQEEIIIVFCNRTGIERDAVFAGTSTVIGVKDGEVNVYGLLGRGEEELLVVDTDKPPSGKLMYCPDDDGSAMVSALESPSDFNETGQEDSNQTAIAKPASPQPPPESNPKRTTKTNAAQDQALLEESRLINRPYSPVSQNKKSNSSDQLSSSQNSVSSWGSQPSQRFQARQETAPSGLTGGESDGSVLSPIQIPSLLIETDTPPTSAQPSPTSPHIPKSDPLVGTRDQGARIHDKHVSTRQQNEVITPTTAFDDVTLESANIFFWPPFDALLETPMEPRAWTPARADSPTLSMGIAAISQVEARTTTPVNPQ